MRSLDTEYYAPILRGKDNEFNPGFFCFGDPACVLWVFRYLEDFELGKWPRDFSWDNTSVGGSSSHISHDGNFVQAKDCIGEIRRRLNMAHYDGILFKMCYEKRMNLREIAIITKRNERDIEARIFRALDFITKPRFGRTQTTKNYKTYTGHGRIGLRRAA